MKRIFSAFFVLVLLLSLLAGCARKEAAVRDDQPTTTATPTLPLQQEMPAGEKEALLQRLEYALLCSAVDANDRFRSMQGWDVVNTQVFLGDYDSDGSEELICGYQSHIFDVAQRTNSYRFSQNGSTFYTDKDGTLYLQDSMGGAYDYELDGMTVEGLGDTVWYSKWNGAEWRSVMSHDVNLTREMILDNNDIFIRYGKTISEEHTYKIDEAPVSKDTYEALEKELGLARVNTYASSFLQNRTEAVYADDLLNEVERYLNEIYGCRRLDADIDGDGNEESLFFITGNLAQVWMDCISYDREFQSIESAQFDFKSLLDPEQARTCFLIADREGSELVLDALCVQAEISVRDGMDIRFADGFMFLDSQPAYMTGSFDSLSAAQLDAYIKVFGYSAASSAPWM